MIGEENVRNNITPYESSVSTRQRERLLGQRGCVLWLTGLSGSGKSTVAHGLESCLIEKERFCVVLDGDNLRTGLNQDLGFSQEDRKENVRRVGEVAALLADAGILTIASTISPFRADRERIRQRVGTERFIEVFVDVPLEVCEARDPKGLYRRARIGEIPGFTGVSEVYEKPIEPDVHLENESTTVGEAVLRLYRILESRGFLVTPHAKGSNA